MNQSIDKSLNSFRRISSITVIAVYFLILVGGIVRSTGSGMGCPDWPKCFGSVIPPTHVDQLPKNYQEIYLEKRLAKNERFVASLEKLGFQKTAEKIANDKSILVEEEFNATKTWIEYINRLIGVLIGFLIMLTVGRSFKLWKMDKRITLLSLFSLVLVLFIGWIGSLVVSTNLLPWMITIHMVLALILVWILLYVNQRSHFLLRPKTKSSFLPVKIQWVLIIGTILMFVQVILGTQVREEVDRVSESLGNLLRDQWIGELGIQFIIHRSYSLVLLGVHLLYFFWAFKYTLRKSPINNWTQVLILLILLEIATGVGMAYFGIPAFLQPVHLVLGSLILGVQFLLIYQIRATNKIKLNYT
ncbi:COX15/CtaA family protein [Algoriphagus sp.]|uniref:COX15/CtaA family protein n=1 Tax=Algoriphagus sp. TaxID=1872435 RepID=UPI0026017243|nr:COX15/CtaA family protein [Algoriphagus sp.]